MSIAPSASRMTMPGNPVTLAARTCIWQGRIFPGDIGKEAHDFVRPINRIERCRAPAAIGMKRRILRYQPDEAFCVARSAGWRKAAAARHCAKAPAWLDDCGMVRAIIGVPHHVFGIGAGARFVPGVHPAHATRLTW
jgi:hypothetical protein